MEQPIESIEYRGFNINIYSDFDPINPIDDFDMFASMACWHNRYQLGHEQPKCDPDEFMQELAIKADPIIEDKIYYWEDGDGWAMLSNKYPFNDPDVEPYTAINQSNERIKSLIQKAIDKHYIILPLYLYDHSGITISTSPFSCPWDSGQVGIIYISIKDVLKEFNRKKMSKKLRSKAINLMIAEVKTYDQYLTGEVYGYLIEPTDKNKSIECDDSCWGFYGYDHEKSGLMEYAKNAIDCAISEYKKEVIANHLRRLQLNSFMQCCWAY
jgi:hypothetical protein